MMTPPNEAHRRAIRIWLGIVALMVFAMVLVGGATRLTDSGLSITEWKPLTGAIPPLTEAQWLSELEKYRQIPEYKLQNSGMTLDQFKFIYWWEWAHRQLGRLIGLAFALPLAFFWVRGRIEPWLKPRLLGLLALGGAQGAIGWWMVSSGLTERTDVSQYRLAIHLSMAFFIIGAIVWTARSLSPVRASPPIPVLDQRVALLIPALVLFQVFLGGLVAGLDAGLTYVTWPLMDGHFIPPAADLWFSTPAWVNHFENTLTVQFQHRMVAYVTVLVIAWHAWRLAKIGGSPRARGFALLGLCLLQAVIGITTLLLMVPMWAGLLHQAGAALLLIMAVVHAQAMVASSGQEGVGTFDRRAPA